MQTYSCDPVADAGRYYDAVNADQEEGSRRIDWLKQSFICDALKLDLSSKSSLNETTIDFAAEAITRRASKVSEVLFESLDWPNGPNVDQLISFVVGKAKDGDGDAASLLDRMATAYAEHKPA